MFGRDSRRSLIAASPRTLFFNDNGQGSQGLRSPTPRTKTCIPQRLFYVNWMLHMSIYVLCGRLVGLALGEWIGVRSRPIRLLWAGIVVIIVAANLVGLGMAP
jgi:hypothetical protein